MRCAASGEVGVSGVGFDGGVDEEEIIVELGAADVLLGLEFVGIRDALLAAVGAADGIDLAGSCAGGAELGDPAFIVGGDENLLAAERDAKQAGYLLEGGFGAVTIVLGVGMVVDIEGAGEGGAGQFDAINGIVRVSEAKGLDLGDDFGFEFFPTGAPGLPGDEAAFSFLSKQGNDCFRFEVIVGNNPKALRHFCIVSDLDEPRNGSGMR